jgi:hypothetical protein
MNVTEAIMTFDQNYGDSDAVREAGDVVEQELKALKRMLDHAEAECEHLTAEVEQRDKLIKLLLSLRELLLGREAVMICEKHCWYGDMPCPFCEDDPESEEQDSK